MATYNKRGYKQPKPKAEKEELLEEQVRINEQDSETAEVFNTLDDNASKVGGWFSRNSKAIFYGIGGVALVAAGWAGYNAFVVEPKQEEAANELFQAQNYFAEALNSQSADSLYNLVLKGGEGKMGVLNVIDSYKGTDAENLAQYYAGTSYYKLKDYKKAIEHLSNFQADDEITKSMSLGMIGDAFSELKQYDNALEYYTKAAGISRNSYTAPRWAFKAGIVALELNKKAEALKFFTDIEENYKSSVEAMNIDVYIGLAQ
ncbi:tetratricopeptide repeat protein [Capnocytophaga sp. ARDL2]|uniref:tetratricopeptide repeat protein n=1 Tax=Capnocytophaga sp. ARDL2 TaxID=3238809 RepID=UPI00355690A8